jgi:NAD dependent epimerase/dehydratase
MASVIGSAMSARDKVLVTGGGGFIGSHLTEAIVRAGADVVALVRYNSRNDWGHLEDLDAEILRSVKVVTGDVRDPHFVRTIVKGRTLVFHLAALIAVPYSYFSPSSYVSTNVEGTLNILQAAMDLGVERVVHTSTSEVYGTAIYVPIDEAHPLQAQSPYAASKIAADKLVESFHHSFSLPVVTVRPFNNFGPRQSARAIIPTIATQAMSADGVRLGRLSPVRDFCFVTDTVRGFLLAAKAPAVLGRVMNLSTGVGVSIAQLAEMIFKLLGVRPEVLADPERVRPGTSEVEKLIGTSVRSKELLGWAPHVTLEDGLSQTVEWLRTHSARYKQEIYNV